VTAGPRQSAPDRRLILAVGFLALAGYYFSQPPIPQDPDYHRFADQRAILGIANGWNVLSNIPFLFVAIAGWRVVRERASDLRAAWLAWPYAVFFLGVALTAFGSGYYHLEPDNRTLVWDRLPMTLAFMGLLSAMIAERAGSRPAQLLFAPLLVAGLVSVAYWYATESVGRGDLRPYTLVQFGSLGFIALLLVAFPARWSHIRYLWAALAIYGAAKICEIADHQVFAVGYVISGHTLKHLLAALAIACVVRMLRVRTPIDVRQSPSDPTGIGMQGLQKGRGDA
jgi:hypothetical protein